MRTAPVRINRKEGGGCGDGGDEGEAYAAKLRAAGNDITTVRYQGTIHDFAMLNALAHTNAAKTAVDHANHFLYTGLHSGS